MLISIHIPKTAGTSIRKIYSDLFPNQDIVYIYYRPPGIQLNEFINRRNDKEYRNAKIIHGHFAFGLHKFFTEKCRYFTFLRDPIDRVISLYYHNLNYSESRNHELVHAEGITLKNFVEERISPQVENSMTKFIAGIEHVAGQDKTVYSNGCPPSLLDVAKIHLDVWFEFIGITELFDESIALLERYLNMTIENPQRVNVTPHRVSQEDLDEETMETIRKYNQLDLELYEYALGLFSAQRSKQVEDITTKENLSQKGYTLNPRN